MNEEIEMAFELAYMPIAFTRQRLNGGDFLGVAVGIMDQVREATTNRMQIREAAETMVNAFNNKLNPKMPQSELDNMVNLLVNNGPMTRAMAAQIRASF